MPEALRHRARTALLTVFLLACLAATAAAQEGNYNVVEVDVVGNRVTSKSLILGVAQIDIGGPLTATVIQNAMHRLYGLGLFRDVTLEAESVTGGVRVYIVVRELPKLAGLNFRGNDKINDKDLTKELGLGVGGYISPYLVYAKAQQIKEMYSDKGYFQAKVTSELDYSQDSSEAVLTYRIDEKSKVKVRKVILTGNERVDDGDIIGKMRNRKRGFLRSSDFSKEDYPEDLEKIINEFHKRGFIDAYLISDSMTIDTTINRMTIYLDVYEGPRYYFGDVTFEGNEGIPSERLSRALKFKEGEVFDEESYQESLFELYSAYQEIGHLHSRIIDERETRSDSIIDVNYEITEGLPSHVNLVRIVGNTKTKDKVIRREISMLPGMVFNRSLLIRSVRDVMALNYFANVMPNPVDLPSGDVDIEFKVEEKQTGQIGAGAGYNSQDKVVGNVGMGIPNLFGNGQSLNFNIEFGSRRNSFSVSFTEPWLFGRPTLLGVDAFAINRRWFDDYTESQQGASIRLGRRLRWPDNYFRVYGSYRLERTRYSDFDDTYKNFNSFTTGLVYARDSTITVDSTATLYQYQTITGDYFPGSILEFEDEWNTASRLSFTITRDSRNLPEFATKGSLVSLSLANTGNVLGGYWNYQKLQLSLAKFIPIVGQLALAAKLQYGAINAPKGDSRIILSDRFTPGGTAYDGIVRGYDDGSLTADTNIYIADSTFWYTGTAPGQVPDTPPIGQDSVTTIQDTVETRVRGNQMLVSNIELQFPIAKQQLYTLLFFDAGNSWLRYKDVKPFDLWTSWGFGFRILVPGIGTIGFDFAKPLRNRDNEGYGWHTHFQIGTTFR